MENGGVTYQNDAAMSMNMANTQDMLMENIGKYVVCELLVGLRSMTVREGILMEVGQDYFILQNPDTGDSTSCDLYSLKFMTLPGTPPDAGGQHHTAAPQHHAATSYCPYTYQRPNCGGGGAPGQSACWIRVD